jgi:A118 family predicted phage portal protein
MFQKILQWIREVFNKMIGSTNVKQALKVDIAISGPMAEALSLWSQMYQNAAPWLSETVKSLNLPASIAGEIARAVTIEMKVEFTGSARAKYLEQQFAPVLAKLREQTEKGVAKGGLIMKPYPNGKNIPVEFVQADCFYPVAFDSSGNITSVIFVDQRTVGDKYYTRLELHQMGEHTDINGNLVKGCLIRNLAFRSDHQSDLGQAVPLASIPEWASIQDNQIIKGIERPLYAYFRFPLANNIDVTSPLGVSCFSRAVDLIEQADRLYSNLLWEFKSGKRKMIVDTTALPKDSAGKFIYPEDKDLFLALDATGTIGEGTKLFDAWSPEFREKSILGGLDAILKRIEYTCGLAAGTISDPNTIEKTATEIAAGKQRSQATIVDTQKSLQSALDQLIYAMDVWATLNNLAPRGAYEIAYDFDDSLVTDKEAQKLQDRQDVGLGALSKWRYLMLTRNLPEAEAKKWVAEAQSEQPQDMFGDQA